MIIQRKWILMSWDVSLIKRCEYCNHNEEIDIGNYTYNISNMYKKAMGYTLSELYGKSANEVMPILNKGISDMEENPEIYQEMNPINGRGNYEGALNFLRNIRYKCILNQDYILCVEQGV